MNLDDEELKATQRMYKGLTKYNVDISGEDKDKVIEILNRLDEKIKELEEKAYIRLTMYEIELWRDLRKIQGEENVKD